MVSPAHILTIGHGNRPLPEFLELLREHRVARLVDVRAYPTSRRHPQFSKDALAAALRESGIDYVHEGQDLGGFRKPLTNSRHSALEDAFRGYADHMQSQAFARAAQRVLDGAARALPALLCAERFPIDCHRRFLADYLATCGAAVEHLIEKDRVDPHALHPALRVDGEMLVYDGGRGRQLSLF